MISAKIRIWTLLREIQPYYIKTKINKDMHATWRCGLENECKELISRDWHG